MDRSYFDFTRTEIEPLLPPTVDQIIDVGCGSGNTSAWLKTKYPGARTLGLEGNPNLRSALSKSVDDAHIVDLEGDIPQLPPADLVLFLDVLEHLTSPERVLRTVLKDVRSGAHVIVSLPNVAHLSVSGPLFLNGSFQYRDAGILDRTHMRFFVRDSAVKLLNGVGLRVLRGLEAGLSGPKTKLADRLTFGRFRDRLTKQYIMLATAMPANSQQGHIAWSVAA